MSFGSEPTVVARGLEDGDRLPGAARGRHRGLAGRHRPARRLLGYEPAVGFADGLAETYSWYVAQGVC